MEKLIWSENKPDKAGLWAYSRNKPDLSIEGICYGPNTAPQTVNYLFCYLGPIPTISPPPKYREPSGEHDIGKAAELSRIEYRHSPDSQVIIWEKDHTISGYQIRHTEKQFWISNKYYGSGYWISSNRLRILE